MDPALLRPLLASLDRPLPLTARVLDLGCGGGRLVDDLINVGFDAWGCDIVTEANGNDRVLPIEQPYRLPFEDSSFDLVCSTEVLEHVLDYETTLSEVVRVLRDGGGSI